MTNNENGFVRFFKKLGKGIVKVFSTLGRWTVRMFCGASKDLAKDDILSVEKLESPGKLAAKEFFSRPLPVVALCVLICMFLFVFFGPLIWPMDANYSDPLQANIAPNYAMLSVPKALKNDIKHISGYSNFTLGLNNSGKMFAWGYTKDSLSGNDYSKFPEGITDNNVVTMAAGSDFAIAVTTDGKVLGWGNKTCAQYGYMEPESGLLIMPDELLNGTIDASKVDYIDAGYQASALVVDGKLYLWGNMRACLNMEAMNGLALTNVKKVAFTNYNVIALLNDGTLKDGNIFTGQAAYSSKDGKKIKNFKSYLSGKKVVDIAATDNCFALLFDDGEILVTGASKYNETSVPLNQEGEKFVSLEGGTRHFAALTDTKKVHLWGDNMDKQTKLDGETADRVFLGAKQTYLLSEEGKLLKKCGLNGYLFGTDRMGRDTFTRIVHGGKMTMTIGAVAVIVSTIIAIIVGCLSGYFGGWVDMLLMRITEIFSSLPFLPFAMMLSYVIRFMDISETNRIFIIMVMLGLLSWTGLARMIRAQVLSVRESEYVTAAKAMGIREGRIAFKHILLNVISVVLVSVTLDFAGCMLTESSLSYLGFGVQQPQPTWGNMLDGAKNSLVIQNYWWQWVFPSLFLAIATISINIIGDALRDVLDPKSTRGK